MTFLYSVTLNGEPFVGSAAQLVQYLHKSSRAPAANDNDWMKETALRVRMQNGTRIRCNNPDAFVRDLIAKDILEQIAKGE